MAVLALADLTACGESGTPTVTEPDQVAVSRVDVSPATATISPGSTQQFTAIPKDAAGNTLTSRTVVWISRNSPVATINSSSGLATGVSAGTATIMGTSEGKTGTTTLTVQDPTEREALVALYNGTDGGNWTNSTGWLLSDNPCDWFGVTCFLGHVTRLDLGSNNLTGSVPSELGNLTGLEFLTLWSNNLTGSIPAELGNLTALRDLRLWSNDLTGSIPVELGNLTALRNLSLSSNSLTGSIPAELGNLAALSDLNLTGNELSGPCLKEESSKTESIDLEEERSGASALRKLVEAHRNRTADVAVTTVTASERQKDGGFLKNYKAFQDRLVSLGLADLTQIHPIAHWDISFFGHSYWADSSMAALEAAIHAVLHPDIPISYAAYCAEVGLDPETKPRDAKWRNRLCDTQIVWSHIHHGRDVLVTSDDDFYKESKTERLAELGVGKVLPPSAAGERLPTAL